ncbi:bifunctional demethylmenaquinone methyltransferase/2-methoxy-6-polyprenyl-1,4-benzoquinol methylase UbiE [Actinopolyspora erythraea]|uniref:Demethylmenaquinone methyltransferase n=1 Tax=Actinopolyspora erythraea TaxID=414996 RepID=A0A099DA60_9ACTN|nr:demethylmenaquinone methyltransferase [Actinopolyspora erythraea]ASU80256.1 bifunctional demethylmenaquinone methyltransferase/2-methoxy-6-polyprenyl-1,4-benzoquinol methylase UbiE [Actinopolyspora erythraea]KGI82662.1 ubiquinone biosynthesis methyltransferase UbiE [Actinopolyspora erythraea]
MSRAGLDRNPRAVAAMFDAVARGYDRTNTVLSFGLDRHWREATRRALAPVAGERILDLAAGTGVSTAEFARTGAHCVAADFSLGMLAAGRHRALPMVAADALRLPFADGAFDGVAMLFGLRNLADTSAGLREMARVVRPGGRLVICEFSTPTRQPLRTAYRRLALRAVPPVARTVASSPDAYVYLAESILAWPDQRELAATITASGWSEVAWRDLTGGIVALHHARKPF